MADASNKDIVVNEAESDVIKNMEPETENNMEPETVNMEPDTNPVPPDSGKRKRSAVQVYVPHFNTPTVKKDLEFEVGKGTSLGQIDIVAELMNKTKADQYTVLHKLCFNRLGDAHSRKKNLRKFNGFPFDNESREYETKLNQIKKLKKLERRGVCKLLGLKQATTSEDLLCYLMSPSDSEKTTSKGKKESPAKKTPAKNKKDSVKKRTVEKADTKNEVTKKSVKVEKADTKKEVTKKSVKVEKAGTKKKVTKKSVKVDEVFSDLSDSEEIPYEESPPKKKQKTSNVPSEEELEKSVKSVVAELDLETVSMKQAISKVFALYPLLDLSEQKPFIKDAIKKLIESKSNEKL